MQKPFTYRKNQMLFRLIIFTVCGGLLGTATQFGHVSAQIIATGAYRQQLKSTPIEMRPNRPLHFYGNAVRRRSSGYHAQPSYGGYSSSANAYLQPKTVVSAASARPAIATATRPVSKPSIPKPSIPKPSTKSTTKPNSKLAGNPKSKGQAVVETKTQTMATRPSKPAPPTRSKSQSTKPTLNPYFSQTSQPVKRTASPSIPSKSSSSVAAKGVSKTNSSKYSSAAAANSAKGSQPAAKRPLVVAHPPKVTAQPIVRYRTVLDSYQVSPVYQRRIWFRRR